ncbi:MAG: polysaccharide biosynthesis C-terminal domain-containing protein [Clostridia bacterium]|nr:polysaccharide biosynthesis C-terminal domain-containing protein [Clostridia bacterium]
MKSKNNLKTGVILSYILLAFNTLYGFVITPYILSHVGVGDYGVYKSVSALSASLVVLDLGLGSTMTRYMAKYNAKNDTENACNFTAMILIQFFVVAVIVILFGVVFYLNIDNIYNASFDGKELKLARNLLTFLIINMVLRLFENLVSGITMGYERFTFTNGIKVISIIIKFCLILILLPMVKNILLVVVLETLIVSLSVIVFCFYNFTQIGVYPKLSRWDYNEFKESFGYTFLMFVQTITIQFNGNIDNVLIGSKISSISVTVYSMALMIYGMYENLSVSISNIMLPQMTKKVLANAESDDLQNSVERIGSLQFILLAAALGGFIVLGRDFYSIWLGSDFKDCYYLTLILIIPVTIPMIQNVCLSILRAQNKMVYRTVTLAFSCVINVIITIFGIDLFGYWGAAVGTSCATLSNIILMNIYYKRKLKFQIIKMFKNIFGKTLIIAAVSSVLTWIIHLFMNGTWFSLIINIISFMVIYMLNIWLWGLDSQSKKMIKIK